MLSLALYSNVDYFSHFKKIKNCESQPSLLYCSHPVTFHVTQPSHYITPRQSPVTMKGIGKISLTLVSKVIGLLLIVQSRKMMICYYYALLSKKNSFILSFQLFILNVLSIIVFGNRRAECDQFLECPEGCVCSGIHCTACNETLGYHRVSGVKNAWLWTFWGSETPGLDQRFGDFVNN